MINYEDGTAWPPAPFDKARKDMHRFATWVRGDTLELQAVYASSVFSRNVAHNGVFTQATQNFFWGRTNTQRTYARHMSTAAGIVAASADLLFSKAPTFGLHPDDVDNTRAQERLDLIFNGEEWAQELLEAGENASVYGGVFLRPWWDTDVVDHVVPSHVPASQAIPEWHYNRLKAVTFETIVSQPGDHVVLRHLERHEPGVIYHAVFQGTENNLGERISLGDTELTQWAKGLPDGAVKTGIDRLDVVYVPNARPSRLWENNPQLCNLGRSDIETIEQELDALDETYSSWLRDVTNGKSRIFLEENMLQDLGIGRGGAFDPEQQVYVETRPTLGSSATAGQGITQSQFPIRWQEHAQTIAEIQSHILRAVGLSADEFADGTLSVGVTATEINARSAQSERTRRKKINFWKSPLAQFVRNVLEIDARQFKTGVVLKGVPTVTFPTKSTQSQQELVNLVTAARGSNLMSTETGVRSLNPDWSDDEVQAELERIQSDQERDMNLAYGKGIEEAGASDVDGGEGAPVDGEPAGEAEQEPGSGGTEPATGEPASTNEGENVDGTPNSDDPLAYLDYLNAQEQ